MKASPLRRAPRAKLLCALVASCFAAEAYANPTGPSVTSGTASFSTVGSTLTVTNSPNSIINWQGFSIGAGEATRFQQQSAASAVLNRVTGQDPSVILGTLWSNGRVFLVNPNGILFGQGSRVDVAGLVASTLNITDSDFLGGRLNFQSGAIANSLVNQGELHSATGGHIYLIAPDVTNSGLITSPQGEVVLAAGKSVSLVDIGTPNLKVEITAFDNEARNLGQIVADSGRIGVYAGLINQQGIVRADMASQNASGKIVFRASGDITLDTGSVTSASGARGGGISIESSQGLTQLAGVIEAKGNASEPGNDGGVVTIKADRLIATGRIDTSGAAGGMASIETNRYLGSGAIEASGLIGDGGAVSVRATEYAIQTSSESLLADGATSGGVVTVHATQRVFSSATLSAPGTTQHGGEVKMLADEVMLYGARINASGESGGMVLVGGDYKGGNPEIPNASRAWVNYSSDIRADAGVAGDGGKVIVWSNNDTRYAGSISARGGVYSGNGGFIEVSGQDNLVFAGMADAGAPNGAPGTVLLDPKNINIDSAGGGLASFQLVDPSPGTGNNFGQRLTILTNNNVVVANPNDDFAATDAGAVHLYNGSTGALVSTLSGSTANDQVGSGSVRALANGNYVVMSPGWANGTATLAGAVTFGNGTSGISGAVSAANSLVGSTANDFIGGQGVLALANGNYVVLSPDWANGAATRAGAATFGSGTTGVSGTVSASNSLVGTTALDRVGTFITALTNGNYVVMSSNWNNGTATSAGAVTFGSGTSGITGTVSAANSLVGTSTNDFVGFLVAALTNGNYVVGSPIWSGGTGAATFGSGTTGITGTVSPANSLVGGSPGLFVANSVTPLTNGNYVVSSSAGLGHATFGNGTTGITGTVSAANSLIGSTGGDSVSSGNVLALPNGNYVVGSHVWNNGTVSLAGAVTFGNGTTGVSGTVSAANSLVGTAANDQVGGGLVWRLPNGNYVVASPNWANGTATQAGAVTFGSGTSGITGAVSAANSLVGSTANDRVGSGQVTALTNGNYVVVSPNWANSGSTLAGAATFGNGTSGIVGAVSATNSLVGTAANDQVGSGRVTALTNGNYVVASPKWSNGAATQAGAVTFGSGTSGISGAVSISNSLVGTTANDQVGSDQVYALTNGNYVVVSTNWRNGMATLAGAVTFGNGTSGITGPVSAANSLVGTTANDQVGYDGIVPLSNGNYLVVSPNWNNGAVTRAGAVTFGNGASGISGAVSTANSLVGTVANDQIGNYEVDELASGNFLVRSTLADNGAIVDAGLVHVVSPGGSFTNPLSFSDNPSNTVTITPAQITAITNTGTAVTLQANNDITLAASSNITTSTGGAGGAITMQAGRSIVVNSNITSDNGAVTLVANERTANGVIDAQRDAGTAVVAMAAGTTINAGNADISIKLNDGAGLTNSTSGGITLANLATTGQVLIRNLGPTVGNSISQQAGSVITADRLLADGGNGSVLMNSSTNMINVLAGSAVSDFLFQNGQSLAIGSVGGTDGITATGALSITAGGAITQSASLTVGGASSFSTGANPITLTHSGNDFTGAVSLTNSGANNVAITDLNAIVLGTSSVGSGTLAVTAAGAITQSGAIVAGTASFNAGANEITLTNAGNDFTGAVSLNNSGANNVAITDANAIILGSSSVGSGTLTVTAGGTITQTGPIVQAAGAGQASFLTTGGGSAITLTNAGNDFTGPVDIDSGTAAIAITDANSFIIKGGGIGGGSAPASFTLNANGTVSQSATFTGTAPAVVVINAGSGPILLNDPANNFSGNVSVAANTTGAVSLINTNAAGINLAASSVGGALSLTSGGPITQTGALTVGGASTLSAGANPITLTNAGNDFTGAVSLSNSGTNNVSITDANAITIGSSTVGGSFDITATSVLFSGGLSVNNYSFTGGTYTLSTGTYNLGGTTTVVGAATVVASGATINASGGTINVSGVLNSGTSSLSVGTLNVLLGGTLSGTGTIIGNVNNSAGTVSPGASPGILTISGNYVHGPSGVLDMQIGGTIAGSQYDQLVVSGTTTLGGTLNTTLINGFVPAAGNTFTLIQSSGALTGTFGTIVQPSGTTFNSFYGPTTFEFSIPGGSSVSTVIEPNFNYTVAALDSPLQPLLQPGSTSETAPGSDIVVAPVTETTTTSEDGTLVKKPPACN
ncbi:MAG: filamentous hemagglutinin N-terminal domain-containing protein [Betaproteobacteria bacterium]|nr:filamentous hemagglutinin N-terminal domain-containing protein [Betaproteobacteria bacterium]